MGNDSTSDSRTTLPGSELDEFGQLIRVAGRREEPPAEDYDRVLAAATASWHAKVGQHRQRRRRMQYGLAAAGLVAAVLVSLVFQETPRQAPIQVASVERVIGTAAVRTPGSSEWSSLRRDEQPVMANAWLRTGPASRIGIVLTNGTSLRLNESTEISLESLSSIRLESGTVYLDSGADAIPGRSVEIVTRAGTAWDVGTQFEVRYLDEALRVRVREGRVFLQTGADRTDSIAGDQLQLGRAGGVIRTRIARDDPEWQWVETVARAPQIDGQSVTVLLEWVARETGREIRFAAPELEVSAGRTILHGNIRHLGPLEALQVMLATTDLDYTILDGGAILIRVRQPDSRT